MKYLLMICGGGREPGPGRIGIEQWVREMDDRGVRRLGRPLNPPQTAVTVRVRHGETLVSDGPFAESKEFVAGLDIVDCADLEEAVAVGARHPVAGSGAVEVRPFVRDFELSAQAREWAASEPPESWLLMMCIDGIPAGDDVEAAIARDGRSWVQRREDRGEWVLGDALVHAEAARTVRVDGDRVLVSDGPFLETTEFIGGLGVLRGVSRQAAVAVAAEHPLAAHHKVEVRRFVDR